MPSLTAPPQIASLEMGFCPGSGQIWGEGPSMTSVTGRRDCWREWLLPGAELAPPCPAGHAFPWPSSTASALRARPSPAHSARPSGDVRVPVCKCRRKASGGASKQRQQLCSATPRECGCRDRANGVCTKTWARGVDVSVKKSKRQACPVGTVGLKHVRVSVSFTTMERPAPECPRPFLGLKRAPRVLLSFSTSSLPHLRIWR